MLYEPRSTERDNQNSLRKFPFSDAAACSNGRCVIPPGAVIDAQLYVPGRAPGRVWLSRIDTNGLLRFSDESGEIAVLSAPATAESAVPVTFTGDGGPCPGGVVVFGREDDVAALLALGGQSFTAEQAELAPAAVSWPGLPGVLGLRLDDGHVVYGNVRIRGENGCRAATYVRDGVRYLRISAVGRAVETSDTTGFIKKVVATSDNTTFVVSGRDVSGKVVDVLATGVSTLQDGQLNADQDNLCETVRRAAGTIPSQRGSSRTCESDVCAPGGTASYRITLFGADDARVTWTDDPDDSYISAMQGGDLGKLLSVQVPAAPTGRRFAGYFDEGGRLYYRHDGEGVGRFDADADVALHAHFIDASSRAEVTFDGYGTLHLAAPSLPTYSNPLRISGNESPVPVVRQVQESVLLEGGAEALEDLVLRPAVPSGEVHIGIRGINKASLL